MSYKPTSGGVPLSDSMGAADPLSDASAKAAARGPYVPVIIDTAITLTGNKVLSNPVSPGGELITTGSFSFSCPSPIGEGALFDAVSTGTVTFTSPRQSIGLDLFSPYTNGTSDSINQWNRWANSSQMVGAGFNGIPGLSLHTSYTNKFNLPITRQANIDLNGMVLSSTLVKNGPYQKVKYPVVAGQTRLTLSSVVGTGFLPGETIRVGPIITTARFPTDGLGTVLTWDGTSILTCYAAAPLNKGATAVTLTGLTSGTIATVVSSAFQLGFCVETLWCIYCENNGMQMFNGQSLWGIGQQGVNTNGLSTPTQGYATNKCVIQNSEFTGSMGMSAGARGFVFDCQNSNNSFCNNNNFYSISPLFTQTFGLDIQNNVSYNSFYDIDIESNAYLAGPGPGAALLNVVSLNNRFIGGLLDGLPTGIPSIANNYGKAPSENFQTFVYGARLTSAPIGNSMTMDARLAYSPTADNILGLMDGFDISGGRAGIRNSGQTNLIGHSSNVPLGRILPVVPTGSLTNWIIAADMSQWLHLTNGFPVKISLFGFAASGGPAGDMFSLPDYRFDMCQTTAGTKFGQLGSAAPTATGGTYGTTAIGMAVVGLSGADAFVADTIQFNGTGPNYTVYQINDTNRTVLIVGVATPIPSGATYTTGAHGTGTVSWSAQHGIRLSSITNVASGQTITASTWSGSSTGTIRSLLGNIAFIDGVTQGTVSPTTMTGIIAPEVLLDTTTSTSVNILQRRNRLLYVDSITGLNTTNAFTTQTTSVSGTIGAIGSPYFGGLTAVGDTYTTSGGGSGTINNAVCLNNTLCTVFTMTNATTLTSLTYTVNDTAGSILTPLGA